MQRRKTLVRRVVGLVAASGLVAAGAAVPADADPSGATGPVFVDGQAQPVLNADPADWIRQEAWVESPSDSDGDGKNDRIHISLTRPAETGAEGLKVPVVYEDSPYFAGLPDAKNWAVDHELGQPPTSRPVTPPYTPRPTSPVISSRNDATWVPRGFATIYSESPGSGLSQGCATSGGRNETLAGKAVVDWLNGRAKAYPSVTSTTALPKPGWTTGNVGMLGVSYNGTLPQAVATTGVKGLKAIIPTSAISSWYDYYRANGMVRAPGGYQGEDLDVLADAVTSRVDRKACDGVLKTLANRQDRVTGDYSPFWAERDYLRDADQITAPALVAHGLNDFNVMTKNASAFYEALKRNGVPHQIYLHQGGHGGSPPLAMQNKWFSRWLYGVDNGVEDGPKAFVVRGTDRNDPTPYAEWPDLDVRPVRLAARGDGSTVGELFQGAAERHANGRVVDSPTTPAQTLAAAATSPNRLLFKTAPLARDTRISGTPYVNVTARFNAPRANMTAVLVQYAADGTPTILTRGWIDPRNAHSLTREQPLTPGRPVAMRIDLQPKDSVIPAGARVGLMLMSSDQEFTVRPKAGTVVDVDLARTSLDLPVVGQL